MTGHLRVWGLPATPAQRGRSSGDKFASQGSTPVKSTVETLSPTRVRLAIEVPFDELEPSLKKAYREIGSQVSIPGFRKGKVPAAVIDQRVGRGTILTEAVQGAIPEQILAAVREHEVRTLGRPEVEITEFGDGQPLRFTAELDVRPEITLPDLSSITVTVDEIQLADSERTATATATPSCSATRRTISCPRSACPRSTRCGCWARSSCSTASRGATSPRS
jgi:trigger factor